MSIRGTADKAAIWHNYDVCVKPTWKLRADYVQWRHHYAKTALRRSNHVGYGNPPTHPHPYPLLRMIHYIYHRISWLCMNYGLRGRWSENELRFTIQETTKLATSNGSWCMGIKGEMSGTVCVTFTWYMYIYELFIAFVCWPEPKQQICHHHANTDHFGK